MNVSVPITHHGSRSPGNGVKADPEARHAKARVSQGGAAADRKHPLKDSVELSREGKASAVAANSLSPDMRRVIQALRARDREVRAHEAAHKSVAGEFAGAIHLEFTTGPDGQQYAVGGEVQIDTAPVAGDPEATIEKIHTIQAAALAPANPSAGDRAVAAKAAQIAIEARVEANRMRAEEGDNSEDSGRSAGVLDRSSPYFVAPEHGAGAALDRVA